MFGIFSTLPAWGGGTKLITRTCGWSILDLALSKEAKQRRGKEREGNEDLISRKGSIECQSVFVSLVIVATNAQQRRSKAWISHVAI